ncbi:uncharacterized protein LOC143613506 [Bidens hawaiensis]|uniref:uncharacterized protein LOC143613506 n=1 Tax=Bidens hawaiensis TaxID=980011 RepID=UPI004049CA05
MPKYNEKKVMNTREDADQDPETIQKSRTWPIKMFLQHNEIPNDNNPKGFCMKGIDIVGKLSKAPGGKVFMLAMTDYFSKWIEVGRVRSSQRTTYFFAAWGVKMITSTPLHPQANEQEESSNKIIINNLKKKLVTKKGNRDPDKDGNTTARSILQNPETNDLDLSDDLDTVDELRIPKVSYCNISTKDTNSYNKNARVKRFQVGDLVLRKAFQNTTDPKEGKLAPRWEGP